MGSRRSREFIQICSSQEDHVVTKHAVFSFERTSGEWKANHRPSNHAVPKLNVSSPGDSVNEIAKRLKLGRTSGRHVLTQKEPRPIGVSIGTVWRAGSSPPTRENSEPGITRRS